MTSKPRLLTGDTPTGRLHLGHWVGSVEKRVALQHTHDCFFIIANTHAFTSNRPCPQAIATSIIDLTYDYLACGIDPEQCTLFIESDVPAIYELATWLSMCVPVSHLMRNPTIKEEITNKQLGEHYAMGFLWYPILQVADILAFQADVVPVGEDQVPHLELARDVARRFNQQYCHVDPHLDDASQQAAGGLFPIFDTLLSNTARLVGIGPPNEAGQLIKMSKSLGNAIMLSDDADTIRKKVMQMYTDPNRLRATDPGNTDNNPLWIFHDTFNPDKQWIEQHKQCYRQGTIGDVACKKVLIDVLENLIAPIRARRDYCLKHVNASALLKQGGQHAQTIAAHTLHKVKQVLAQQL